MMYLDKIGFTIGLAIATSAASAATTTWSDNNLYDLQLNAINSIGGSALVETSTPTLTSSSQTGTQSLSKSNSSYDSGIVSDISKAPEVGVPGQIDFYYVTSTTTTTTTYDRDYKKENSYIRYNGSAASQNTASTYSLNGSMQQNADQGILDPARANAFNIGTGMTVSYTGDQPYTAGSMLGALTIEYASGVDTWVTSRQLEFTFDINNTMSIYFDNNYDIGNAISFNAIFEIMGTNLSYSIDNLNLYASTYGSEYSSNYNIVVADPVTVETQRYLVDSAELPALPEPTMSPVPVPAAAWLFGSGLIALAGFARRKKA